MKKLIAIVFAATAVLALATAAEARSLSLPDDAVALVRIPGKIVDVSPLCPAEVTCFLNGTGIRLRFDMLGCLDQLVPISYRFVDVDGVRNIFVDALNVQTRGSMAAFCAVAPSASASIDLISYYGPFKIHFLGTRESISHEGM